MSRPHGRYLGRVVGPNLPKKLSQTLDVSVLTTPVGIGRRADIGICPGCDDAVSEQTNHPSKCWSKVCVVSLGKIVDKTHERKKNVKREEREKEQ